VEELKPSLIRGRVNLIETRMRARIAEKSKATLRQRKVECRQNLTEKHESRETSGKSSRMKE
jgi:hypothetical protein